MLLRFRLTLFTRVARRREARGLTRAAERSSRASLAAGEVDGGGCGVMGGGGRSAAGVAHIYVGTGARAEWLRAEPAIIRSQ